MTIQDATKEVIAKRDATMKRESWRVAEVFPTWIGDEAVGSFPPSGFYSIFGCGWKPKLDDLLADDWTVVDKPFDPSEPKPAPPFKSEPWELQKVSSIQIVALVTALISLITSILSLLLT